MRRSILKRVSAGLCETIDDIPLPIGGDRLNVQMADGKQPALVRRDAGSYLYYLPTRCIALLIGIVQQGGGKVDPLVSCGLTQYRSMDLDIKGIGPQAVRKGIPNR